MRITYRQGSNQYVKRQKSRTLEITLAIALLIYTGALGYKGIADHMKQDATVDYLKQFQFGQFPALVVAAEPKIAGMSAEIKEPTVENVVAEIARVFAPYGKQVVKQALEVSACESGWRAEAYNFNTNKTGDYNIFQINSVHEKRFGTLYRHNWVENIRVAEVLYREQKWTPWVCAKKLSFAK